MYREGIRVILSLNCRLWLCSRTIFLVSISCGFPFPHYRFAVCGVDCRFRFLQFSSWACFFTLTCCINLVPIRTHIFLQIHVPWLSPSKQENPQMDFFSSFQIFSASHRRPQLDDFDFPHLRMAKKSIFKLQPEVASTPFSGLWGWWASKHWEPVLSQANLRLLRVWEIM